MRRHASSTDIDLDTLDLFSDETLTDPYPAYAALRAHASATYLPRHDVWAVGGYRHVRTALDDHETYSSDRIALTDHVNEQILAGTVLAAEGAAHARLRRPLSRQLNPRAMRDLGDHLHERADQLVAEYTADATFDAAHLAEHFVADTVIHLMGLPEGVRRRLIDGAAATFDVFGPANDRYLAAAPVATELVAYLHTEVSHDRVRPGSWIAALYEAADQDLIEASDIVPLMSAYTAAAMDTTILGLGTACALLASHPEQWAQLRDSEITADAVFHESLRLEAPVQGFGRRVTRTTTLGDTPLSAGARIWLLYGATGRDQDTWGPDADRFDPTRPAHRDHLAFGSGPHLCAGNHLAVLQARALLTALTSRYGTFRQDGTPTRALNNVLRGYAHVPVRVR